MIKLALFLAALALAVACSGSSGSTSSLRPSNPVSTQRPTIAASVSQGIPTPAPSVAQQPDGPTGETQEARVTGVADGDTIRVSVRGVDYRVRYIGIDAPELGRAGQPAESFAQESLAANRQLVRDQTVTLEKDVSETDQFGRLLRYVWLADGDGWLLVNAELVRLGFAHAGTYPPDVKYTDILLSAERAAREGSAGLWADAPRNVNPIAQPIPTPTPTPEPKPERPPARDCDPSYPDICVPPSPPDLDCRDVSFRRFAILAPDPHRFDGDGDGVGCES